MLVNRNGAPAAIELPPQLYEGPLPEQLSVKAEAVEVAEITETTPEATAASLAETLALERFNKFINATGLNKADVDAARRLYLSWSLSHKAADEETQLEALQLAALVAHRAMEFNGQRMLADRYALARAAQAHEQNAFIRHAARELNERQNASELMKALDGLPGVADAAAAEAQFEQALAAMQMTRQTRVANESAELAAQATINVDQMMTVDAALQAVEYEGVRDAFFTQYSKHRARLREESFLAIGNRHFARSPEEPSGAPSQLDESKRQRELL